MAPPEVLDYIVVHELAHLAELNHSAKFWLIVRSHCPDFKRLKGWLKRNGELLKNCLSRPLSKSSS
jgi:predicted metal-dependent hydrolase